MLYYAYGTALLTQEEVRELNVTDRVINALAKKSVQKIDLFNGVFDSSIISGSSAAQPTEWQAIGLGKPLTLEIRAVYTGKYPGGGIFSSTSPMLVTSAVKSIATYEAKPIAINFLKKITVKNSCLHRPAASEEGTPVIFYSPAMIDRSLTVDLTMVFDEFPQQAFDAVGAAFKSAAGIPVFLTHSMYLLAAGEVARLVGQTGEALFDGKPVLQISESIDLALPGTTPTAAGFMVVTQADVDKVEPGFREKYRVSNGVLVDGIGTQYAGDVPYIVLAVDGTPREDYSKFAPTAASAAVLSRYFGVQGGKSTSLSPLLDAIKLYSEFTYREQWDKIDKKIASMKDGNEVEKNSLIQKREALAKNITTDLLKPQK